MVEFGIRIEFRRPKNDLPHDGYVAAMMREGFRLPTLPSPGDGMTRLAPWVKPFPVPVAQVQHYPAPHWTNDGMEDGDGPGVDVIVHAYARALTEEQISEFQSRAGNGAPGDSRRRATAVRRGSHPNLS